MKFYLGILAALFFINTAHAKVNDVKVGVLFSKTGAMAEIGQEGLNGFEMALEQLKDKMENKSFKVTFVMADSKSEPEKAVKMTKELIEKDKVNVILGDLTSNVTLAAAQEAQKDGVPILTPSSTNDNITKIGDYVSRICFVDSFQGLAMAQFVRKNLKNKSAVVLVDEDMIHSRDVSKIFEEAFKKVGGQVLKTIVFAGSKRSTYQEELSEIQKLNPDVVYAPVYYSVMGLLFKEANALKIKAKFIGTDAWDSPQLFQIAQGNTEGGMMTNPFSYQAPEKKVQEFRLQFKKLYGKEPNAYAALAYDAVYVLFNALERVRWPVSEDKLSYAINQSIVSTANLHGVTGDISLDSNRNVKKPHVVILKLNKTGYDYYSSIVPR